ncbi:MAG: hypothetical protein WD231_04585 [Candidatus Woykebacteria bacterium]
MTAQLPSKKVLIALLTTVFALATLSSTLFAQESDQKEEAAEGSVGIQISAPIYNFEIDPGKSAQEIIKVRNVSNIVHTFYPEVFDFKPKDETGTPEFLIGDQSNSYGYSLASWIKIAQEGIKLAPDESAALNFTINVPADAEPGGHYAGVLFGTSAPKVGGSQIGISNKVGSLILVRVAGDAKESANIKEFTTSTNFYEQGPVPFTVRVENTGNVHVIPKGVIEIKNIFGSSVATLNVNEKDGSLLPESIRAFMDKDGNKITWSPDSLTIGRFTATLNLTYGDPAKNLTSSVTFWVVPWKILLVILLGLIIIILMIIFLVKKYNRWIVSRATNNASGPGQNPPTRNSQGGPASPPIG